MLMLSPERSCHLLSPARPFYEDAVLAALPAAQPKRFLREVVLRLAE